MSIAARSRQASIAAEPVSPEVAPTIVTCSPRRASTASNSRPDQLQRQILEGQGRAVKQLQQPEPLVELHQRRHRRVRETAIGRALSAAAIRPRKTPSPANSATIRAASSA